MRAIFAVNARNGFAIDGGLPWPHSTVDMRRFRELTVDSTVVMGRSTWTSPMPTPLPRRKNVVLSNTLVDNRAVVCATIPQLLEEVALDERVWVIGGVQTLWALRPHITEVHLSTMLSTTAGDVSLDATAYLEGFTRTHKQWHDDHIYTIHTRNIP